MLKTASLGWTAPHTQLAEPSRGYLVSSMCRTDAPLSEAAASATGAFSAAATLPCACEMVHTLKSRPSVCASGSRIFPCVR